jgi:hypothetical protein
MKKVLVVFCVLAVSVFLFQAPAQAQTRFSFKVTGGLAYLGGGDVNTGLQGWSDAWYAIFHGVGLPVSGGYAPFHLGMDFGGEFMIHFSPAFAVALGTGYIQATKSSTLTITSSGTDYFDTWAPKVSAIPITATFYFFLPSSGSVKIYLNAGVGYYLGKYTDSWHIVFLGEADETLDTTANGFGVHGGIGIEFPLSPSISIVAEARGRYASLGNFKGTDTFIGSSSTTGNAYIVDLDALGFGTFPGLTISDTTPTGTGVRAAKIDLSGFSAVIGFLFHF